jgi:hypothetical protein
VRFIDEMNKKGHAIPVVFYPLKNNNGMTHTQIFLFKPTNSITTDKTIMPAYESGHI